MKHFKSFKIKSFKTKNFKTKNFGFSLIEAILAIAIVGFMLTGLLGLQFTLLTTTFKAHRRLDPLILLKNFLYETERKILEDPKNKQTKFNKTLEDNTEELIIEIKKTEKNKSLINFKDLLILDLIAKSKRVTKEFEEHMLYIISDIKEANIKETNIKEQKDQDRLQN